MEISKVAKRKLDGIFEAMSIAAEGAYVYVCDMEYDYSRWSQNAVDYFDLPGSYMYQAGAIWNEHIHPEDRKSYGESIEEIFAGTAEGHDMQYRALDRNGNYAVCTCRGSVIRDSDDNVKYFVGIIRNHGLFGHVNMLTGLRNQYGFFEDLKVNIAREQPFSVTMFGLAHFTEVNTMYGYQFGNLVIQRIAREMQERMGTDCMLYRLDGVRFGIISPMMEQEKIRRNYEMAKRYLGNGIKVDGRRISIDTVGGTMFVDHFPISDEIVYSCLCYAYDTSKRLLQGDLQFFDNRMRNHTNSKVEMLNELRSCVAEDCRGFRLFYQPTVEANTEELHGAEALIRWQDEKYGLVMPDEFIPVLENDTIFPILGEWILRQAMTDGKRLLKYKPEFIMNVNLSYAQIKRQDFVDIVHRLLEETEFPPGNLCMEITERCRFVNKERLSYVVLSLKDMGIRVALDDFGTGFSSVLILKEIPFDTIKIDRAFVKNIETDNKDEAMLEHFTGMATLYGADVCVEGVETTGMREKIVKGSTNTLQGYLYSKPIPIEDFIKKYGLHDDA